MFLFYFYLSSYLLQGWTK